MEKEVRRQTRINLALAIAEGGSIIAWANQNDVPERTAFRWARDPKFRRAVEASRRRALGPGAPGLSDFSVKAADRIVTLAKEADSESVQLRAWRAILADQMAVSKFSDLEYRMAEIEEQLGKRTGHTDHAG